MVTENRKIRVDNSEIWVDDSGILILDIAEDAEVEVEEVIKCFDVYHQLGFGSGNKTFQLIHARGNAQMSPEGRKYASAHVNDFFIACAVISKSLTIRLLVNFFNSFYKNRVPFKMFATEEAARKWLKSFK